jgi:1-acyl-sn-glycerol-3-phosphate acyltransferase
MPLVRGIRSLTSVLLVGLLFVLGSVVLRLLVLPGAWLFPSQRFRLVSLFMKGICHGISGLLTLGGARIRRVGTVPTASPVLVVANHQSLLDIVQITLLSRPGVPAFVTRTRYGRFIPLVSACVRLLGGPLIDPRGDPRGAVRAIRAAASGLPHGMIIFPEGHRTPDGSILPFRTSGIEAALGEKRTPVHLVLNDGVWRVRRFADLLFRVHLIDAVASASGPYEPPDDPAQLPAFVQELRGTLVAQLDRRREESVTRPAA